MKEKARTFGRRTLLVGGLVGAGWLVNKQFAKEPSAGIQPQRDTVFDTLLNKLYLLRHGGNIIVHDNNKPPENNSTSVNPAASQSETRSEADSTEPQQVSPTATPKTATSEKGFSIPVNPKSIEQIKGLSPGGSFPLNNKD
ncbi:MAG: hypothetical protein WDZ94_05645 [Patescibacteria group bacterium]